MTHIRFTLALLVAFVSLGNTVAWGATLEEIQAPPSLPSLGIGPPSFNTPLPFMEPLLPAVNTPLPSMEIGPPVTDTPLPAGDTPSVPADTPLPPAGSIPEEPPGQPAEDGRPR
jgi:hypothetical protein